MDSDNGETIVITVDDEMTLLANLVNLIPNMKYHISVVAYTSVGPGTAANLSVTTTSNENMISVENVISMF